MQRVTGIGGVFFNAQDPKMLQAWYRDHLGTDVQAWGGASFSGAVATDTTAWAISAATDDAYAPGTAPFMVNYRVADLRALLEVLRQEGCNVLDAFDESEFGKFGWVIDPEGNKVELWEQPVDQ